MGKRGKTNDLEALESKAWTSTFEDGLWEIIIGLVLLTMVIGFTIDAFNLGDTVRIAVTIPLFFIGPFILYFGKMYMTVPRIGIVRFSQRRKERRIRMYLIILGGTLVTCFIWTLTMVMDIGSPILLSAAVSILIFTMFCGIAYFFEHRKFYIVALLVSIGEPLYMILDKMTDLSNVGIIAWGIPAAIVLVMGAISLGRFLRKYPQPSKEASNAA